MIDKEKRGIPSKILDYCQKRGYLDLLEKRKNISESDRFDAKDIRNSGLDVFDAIECVLDKKRTVFFIDEIKKSIKKNDQVLEAGIGTGILSFETALQGAHISGIEINKSNLLLARNIKNYLKEGDPSLNIYLNRNPIFYYYDALKYHSNKNFDSIISENIYTGMFYEKQVQIMNHLINFLKPSGIVIPSKMISYLSLCEINKDVLSPKTSLLVVDEIKKENKKPSKYLCKPLIYSALNFREKNNENIDFVTKIKITEDGVVNGIYINSNIEMPSGTVIRGSETTFFGNDIIIPIKNPVKILKNDQVEVRLKYQYGANPKDAVISVSKI